MRGVPSSFFLCQNQVAMDIRVKHTKMLIGNNNVILIAKEMDESLYSFFTIYVPGTIIGSTLYIITILIFTKTLRNRLLLWSVSIIIYRIETEVT